MRNVPLESVRPVATCPPAPSGLNMTCAPSSGWPSIVTVPVTDGSLEPPHPARNNRPPAARVNEKARNIGEPPKGWERGKESPGSHAPSGTGSRPARSRPSGGDPDGLDHTRRSLGQPEPRLKVRRVHDHAVIPKTEPLVG